MTCKKKGTKTKLEEIKKTACYQWFRATGWACVELREAVKNAMRPS